MQLSDRVLVFRLGFLALEEKKNLGSQALDKAPALDKRPG